VFFYVFLLPMAVPELSRNFRFLFSHPVTYCSSFPYKMAVKATRSVLAQIRVINDVLAIVGPTFIFSLLPFPCFLNSEVSVRCRIFIMCSVECCDEVC
jgi:hypothetical protein